MPLLQQEEKGFLFRREREGQKKYQFLFSRIIASLFFAKTGRNKRCGKTSERKKETEMRCHSQHCYPKDHDAG